MLFKLNSIDQQQNCIYQQIIEVGDTKYNINKRQIQSFQLQTMAHQKQNDIVGLKGILKEQKPSNSKDILIHGQANIFQQCLCASTLNIGSNLGKSGYIQAGNRQDRQIDPKVEQFMYYLCYNDGTNKIIHVNPHHSIRWLEEKLQRQIGSKVRLTINNQDLIQGSDSLIKYTYDRSIIHVNKKQQIIAGEKKLAKSFGIKIKKCNKQGYEQKIIQVCYSTKIQDLVKEISLIFGIQESYVRLDSAGKLLQGSKFVENYDIIPDSVIYAVDARVHEKTMTLKQYENYMSKLKSRNQNSQSINTQISQIKEASQKIEETKEEPKPTDQKSVQKGLVCQSDQNKSQKQNPESNCKARKKPTNKSPFIISGCSGAGKGTLVNYLKQKYPDIFELSISYTTRNPRKGQTHGIQYYFVSVEDFEKQVEKDAFVESGKIYGNYYGTHKSQIQRIQKKEKICLLQIDLKAAQKIYNQTPDCHFLFINVPKFQDLRERMIKRGTQTEQKIQTRMNHSRSQLQKIKQLPFYQQICNDNLESTKAHLVEFLRRKYGNIFD